MACVSLFILIILHRGFVQEEWFNEFLTLASKPMDLSSPVENNGRTAYALHGFAALPYRIEFVPTSIPPEKTTPEWFNDKSEYLLQRIVKCGGASHDFFFLDADVDPESEAYSLGKFCCYPLEFACETKNHFKFEQICKLMIQTKTLTDWNNKDISPWELLIREGNYKLSCEVVQHCFPNIDLECDPDCDLKYYYFNEPNLSDNHLLFWRNLYDHKLPEYLSGVNSLLFLSFPHWPINLILIVISCLTPNYLQSSSSMPTISKILPPSQWFPKITNVKEHMETMQVKLQKICHNNRKRKAEVIEANDK